jgi:two-component system, LuxR family, response regulator FixJ
MNTKQTIHLVDDDISILNSIATFLRASGFDVEIYNSPAEFLESVTSATTGCVVTDVRMNHMTGIELVVRLRERRVAIPAIIMTAHADVALAITAMRLGVLDMLEKPFSNATLIKSIEDTLARWNQGQAGPNREAINGRLRTLTNREKDVLSKLLNGLPNKIIAHELGVSTRTVETHRATVMSKMKASSLAELVRMTLSAQETGL